MPAGVPGRPLGRERRAGVAGRTGKLGWKIMVFAFAVPTGIVARKTLDATWRAIRRDEPPRNPAAPGTAWREALAWAAVSGVAVAGARLVAARGAAATWKSLTGRLPPGVEEVGP
jgi:Protein of unknown function (DUF4235)